MPAGRCRAEISEAVSGARLWRSPAAAAAKRLALANDPNASQFALLRLGFATAALLPRRSLPQLVQSHRNDDHNPDNNLLHVRRPAHLIGAVPQHSHNQGADH